ncbi:class I SAM-dependent methyltransferase [Aliikangiella sp. G2MR2-5]|uniref:class I SAM-dependent DNA methyltransferase n=1 Tax=Aliikangiella sp. G2MR2-5 TaxID=2788943 RepID=UPI0018A980F2|nr:class I SAM-dependent methyltransferase [Aliikangiella sp. G2MR2-5]
MSSNDWDDYAEEWDTNDDVNRYSEKAFDALTTALSIDNLRILDFGCGTGLLSEKLAHQANFIVALDPSTKMIEVLRNKKIKNVDTIAEELTSELISKNHLLQQKFDLIVCSSALAFVPEYEKTLTLLTHLLKGSGYLVQWDWYKEEGEEGSGFSKQQVKDAFESAGLSKVAVTIPFSMQAGNNAMDVIMGIGYL